MQAGPQDGVAADALPAPSTPAVPTPPTIVSVAATASTLLLMDMGNSSLGTHSRALRTATLSSPPQRTSDSSPIASARCRLAVGLTRTRTCGPDRSCSSMRARALHYEDARCDQKVDTQAITVTPAPPRGTGVTGLLRV